MTSHTGDTIHCEEAGFLSHLTEQKGHGSKMNEEIHQTKY